MAARFLTATRHSTASIQTTHAVTPGIRSATNKAKHRQADPEPELPSFSLKDLGASPTVKAVVYTALGIAGTAETYFWCRWGWEKFKPDVDPNGTKEASQAAGDD